VSNWRRGPDPLTGGLSPFGFCDYTNPDGAIRALLLLNNASIDGQPLLVRWAMHEFWQLGNLQRSSS